MSLMIQHMACQLFLHAENVSLRENVILIATKLSTILSYRKIIYASFTVLVFLPVAGGIEACSLYFVTVLLATS